MALAIKTDLYTSCWELFGPTQKGGKVSPRLFEAFNRANLYIFGNAAFQAALTDYHNLALWVSRCVVNNGISLWDFLCNRLRNFNQPGRDFPRLSTCRAMISSFPFKSRPYSCARRIKKDILPPSIIRTWDLRDDPLYIRFHGPNTVFSLEWGPNSRHQKGQCIRKSPCKNCPPYNIKRIFEAGQLHTNLCGSAYVWDIAELRPRLHRGVNKETAYSWRILERPLETRP